MSCLCPPDLVSVETNVKALLIGGEGSRVVLICIGVISFSRWGSGDSLLLSSCMEPSYALRDMVIIHGHGLWLLIGI